MRDSGRKISLDSAQALDNDRRESRRKSIYLSDRIDVSIREAGSKVSHQLTGHCKDISIEGIGVYLPKSERQPPIAPGSIVEIQIKTAVGSSRPIDAILLQYGRAVVQNEEFIVASLKFQEASDSEAMIRSRIGTAFEMNEFLQPQAVANDPLFFSESFFFRVVSFSANGCRLLSSIRNKSIIPGIALELDIFLPNVGTMKVGATPLRISKASANEMYFHVDVEFKHATPALNQAISEYLLVACPGLTIKDLRANGFFVSSTHKALSIGHPQSQEDFAKILDLRLSAYNLAGKFLDRKSPDQMRDAFDAHSRQIICRVSGKIVGAIRVVFVGHEPLRSEHSALGIHVPDFLFKGGFVEFSRACTDPDFRGSEVFAVLMQHSFKVGLEGGARYAVANCNSELWPTYKKVGAKKAGPKFEAFGRKDCQLIYFDLVRASEGRIGSFLGFNQVLLPVALFWNRHRTAATKIKSAPRLAFHKVINPLVSHLRTKQAFKKHKSKRTPRL